MTVRTTLFFFLTFLVLQGCLDNPTSSHPDVGQYVEELKVVHFEKLLVESRDTMVMSRLFEKHPVFTEVFSNQVLSYQRGMDPVDRLSDLALDTFTHELYQASEHVSSWNPEAQEELQLAFALARYYWPDFQAPSIFTCISQFEVGSFTIGKEILGIGLDFYLGPAYSYDPILFPEYISRTMTPDYLVSKSIQVVIEEMVGPEQGVSLLDHMVRNGKVLYLKEKLLPHSASMIIHEFTPEEMQWVEENESEIWAFLVSEGLLHETNSRKFRKLISPSPSIPGMPEEAPGRVGNWIGYRIVSDFAKNQAMDPAELLGEHDAQKVLARSKYRPRR